MKEENLSEPIKLFTLYALRKLNNHRKIDNSYVFQLSRQHFTSAKEI